jgi:hypothetical protein
MRKISLSEWATGQIRDKNLHHIGEYYQFISGKYYLTPSGKHTSGFKEWFRGWMIAETLSTEERDKILENFEIIRDWDACFFLRHK